MTTRGLRCVCVWGALDQKPIEIVLHLRTKASLLLHFMVLACDTTALCWKNTPSQCCST